MPLRHLGIAALIVSGLSAVLFSNEFYAVSGDVGPHYALIRAIMDLHGWGRPPPAPNLGPMAFYPPLAHWLAAEIGELLGSGLLGMTVVASSAVGLFYLAMFIFSFRIDRHAPLIACFITIIYALLRGPIFGRQVVNNYFFSQLVGSTIAIWTLLIVLHKFHKWKAFAIDLFVLGAGQVLVATHLTPAAQLLAAYCTILLIHAWNKLSWESLGRLILFLGISLILTFLNPIAHEMIVIAQAGGGAHVNHMLGNRFVQIIFLILGCYASIKLILNTRKDEDAGMFLGCMGLSSCGLAFIQIFLLCIGIGSDYAIAKHLFVAMALFIFVVSANLSLKTIQATVTNGWSAASGLASCSILALLTSRADLYPSMVNLNEVEIFQSAIRDLMGRIDISDGRRPIALATNWPKNISYMITAGDLRFPIFAAADILFDKPLPEELVSVVLMPADDPSIVQSCTTVSYSNQAVTALNYSCFLQKRKLSTKDGAQ